MSMAGRLQQFLDKNSIEYHEGKRAFITTCMNPSCGKEDHCYIWKADAGAICFRCGKTWRWRWMVAAIARCTVHSAYSVFFGTGAGDEINKDLDPAMFDEPEVEELEEAEEPEVNLGPDFFPIHHSQRGLEYVVKRGVTNASVLDDFDLRYHGLMDAVVFPVKKDGKVYGWQARRIDPREKELRLISHTFAKGKFLLNWDYAKTASKVALVEGPFDCVHVDLRKHGFAGIASLGKGISPDQIKLILDLPAKDIYIGLDPDASEQVYEVVGKIGLGKRLHRITPQAHRKDFGESTDEETLKSFQEAIPMAGQSDLLEVYFK